MKKNIVIMILAILVLGLGGYLVYDKALTNDNNEIENTEVKEESYDLAAAKELIDKYYYSYATQSGTSFTTGYTEDAKKYLAALNVSIKDVSTINCLLTYNNEGYQYEINLENGGIGYCYGDTNSISYSALSESYKKLFGNDKVLKKNDFIFGAMIYDYNEKLDSFVKLSCECGGGLGRIDLYSIKNAKKIDNKLIINVGRAEIKPGVLAENNYTDEFFTIDINGQTLKYNYDDIFDDYYSVLEEFESEFFNKYLDKLDTYKFTFFEENGVYKLEHMVKA